MSEPVAESSRYVGPYRIEGRLGRGGMGEVFRAYDARLDRYVALKQLRGSGTQKEQNRKRLLREARSAAKLSHPTIVQVHDILEVDGHDWIVMELVEGRSMKDALAGKAFKPERTLALAAQITKGLATAHAAGIVHRDLKSENIILTPTGRPKILDFGLAKDLFPEDDSTLSRHGQVIGTPRAMSPEQARGKPVDPRTDLFALGVLLYEMLTRTSPFNASTPFKSIQKICTHEPPPPSSLARVPVEIDDLVLRLLARDPDQRPQSAEQVHRELRSLLVQLTGDEEISDLGSPPPPAAHLVKTTQNSSTVLAAAAVVLVALLIAVGYLIERARSEPDSIRIAVRPFIHQGNSQYGFFAPRLTDDVIQLLRQVDGLIIIRLLEQESSPPDLGAESPYDFLLHASVQWTYEETPQVIVRPALEHNSIVHWSTSFSKPLTDIIAMQRELSRGIVQQLLASLDDEGFGLENIPTEDWDANRRYRTGSWASAHAESAGDLERADLLFEQVLARDPDSAVALAARAENYLGYRRLGLDLSLSRLHLAKEAMEKALGLVPDLPEGHLARGAFFTEMGLWSEALAALGKVQEGPNGVRVALGEARVRRRQGRFKSARGNLRLALKTEPELAAIWDEATAVDMDDGRFPEAMAVVEEGLRKHPDHPDLQIRKAWLQMLTGGQLDSGFAAASPLKAAWLLLLAGQSAESLERLEQAPALRYEERWLHSRELLQGWALESLGKPGDKYFEAARRVLEAEVALSRDARAFASLAACWVELGEIDRALSIAEQALERLPPERDAVAGTGVAVTVAGVRARAGQMTESANLLSRVAEKAPGMKQTLEDTHPLLGGNAGALQLPKR